MYVTWPVGKFRQRKKNNEKKMFLNFFLHSLLTAATKSTAKLNVSDGLVDYIIDRYNQKQRCIFVVIIIIKKKKKTRKKETSKILLLYPTHIEYGLINIAYKAHQMLLKSDLLAQQQPQFCWSKPKVQFVHHNFFFCLNRSVVKWTDR